MFYWCTHFSVVLLIAYLGFVCITVLQVNQENNENHYDDDNISHGDPEGDCQSYVGDPANEVKFNI